MEDPNDNFWWRLTHLNPVLFRSAVTAVMALLLSLGIVIAPAIPDNLVNAVWAIAALVGALWSREGVVPNDKVVVYQPDPVRYPSAILPGAATAGGASEKAILDTARRAGPPLSE